MDRWFAECVPCRWRESYDTEDSAIAAAEKHVAAKHADVPAPVRAAQVIGHVQLRGDDAVGYEFAPEPEPAPAAVALPGAGDATGTQ